MKHIKNQDGQTLLEVVVTVGVALVIIGSLVTLMNASTRRSTLARQATQASKLAQEGMEIVRNIRDVDASNAVKIGLKSGGSGVCNVATPCSFDDLYTIDQGSPLGQLQKPSDCGVANSYCLVGLGVGSGEVVTLGASYTRTVTISDGANICATVSSLGVTDIKKVAVFVTWDSPIGTQTRRVESCLRRKD